MLRVVREFGFIGTRGGDDCLDFRAIGDADFQYLRLIALRYVGASPVLRLCAVRGQEVLQVQNYVGVLSLPSGDQIEIVPKTSLGAESVAEGRRVLLKMLSAVYELDFNEADFAQLDTLRRPWLEALIRHALLKIAETIRGGLCKSYRRRSSEGPYLRVSCRLCCRCGSASASSTTSIRDMTSTRRTDPRIDC